FDLECGLQVQFNSNQSQYRVGDYWLIPSRENTNNIEWPISADGYLAQNPQGIKHYYTKLALCHMTKNGWDISQIEDWRYIFDPKASEPISGKRLIDHTVSVEKVDAQFPDALIRQASTIDSSKLTPINGKDKIQSQTINIDKVDSTFPKDLIDK